MSGNDYYMYSYNRFAPGMGNIQNRTQYAFQQATSAHYRQFHEMKSQMPSDVLQLFKANDVGFLKAPVKKKCRPLDPVANINMNLSEMFSIPNLQLMEQEKKQTKAQRKQRIIQERLEKHNGVIKERLQQWNPFSDQRIVSEPENTLFVARLNYKTAEKELKFEFERFGRIKSVHIVRDKEGKSRGYGFVQFQNKSDFTDAYKNANLKKINGRKIIVDYERGRSSLSWRPRFVGGGLGGQFRMTRQQYDIKEAENKIKKSQKNYERSRSRSRSRQKRRHYEERDRERERDRQRDRQRDRDRDHKKREKRSKERKQKKEKKEKREKRDYIAMRVPAEEFKN